MSKEIKNFITWIRTFLDDVYAPKGSSGGISLNDVYPIGAIYMSATSDDPASLFGGTWVKIENRFLLAGGSSYSPTYDSNGFANKTGGSATVALTSSQMPRHTHTQNTHNHIQNEHNHTQNAHTHTQNAHAHRLNNSAVVYNASGNYVQNASGGGTKSSLNTNLNVGTDNQTATNQNTTATNIATTATNQETTATNQYTGGTGTSQSASNGSAHENMPPYLVVNIWKRTA